MLEKKHSELKGFFHKLEQEYADLLGKCDSEKDQYHSLKDEHLELKKTKDDMERKHFELKGSFHKLERKYAGLLEKVESEKDQYHSLKDEHLELKKTKEDIKNAHQRSEKKHFELKDSFHKLEQEHSDLVEKMEFKEDQYHSLKCELQELKKTKDEIEKKYQLLEKKHSELKDFFHKPEREYADLLEKVESEEDQQLTARWKKTESNYHQLGTEAPLNEHSKGIPKQEIEKYAFLFETYLKHYLPLNEELVKKAGAQERTLKEPTVQKTDSIKREEPVIHMNEADQNTETLKQHEKIDYRHLEQHQMFSPNTQQPVEELEHVNNQTQSDLIQVLLEQKNLIMNLQEQIKEIKMNMSEKQRSSEKGPFNMEMQPNQPVNPAAKSVTFRDLQGSSTMQPTLGSKASKHRADMEYFQKNQRNFNKPGLDYKQSGTVHDHHLYNKDINHWSGKGPYVINLPPIQANSSTPKEKSKEKAESDSEDISTAASSDEMMPNNKKKQTSEKTNNPVQNEGLEESSSHSHSKAPADIPVEKEKKTEKKRENSAEEKHETQHTDAKKNQVSSPVLDSLESERPSRSYRIVSTYERKANTLDKEATSDKIAAQLSANQEANKTNEKTAKLEQDEVNKANKQTAKLEQQEVNKENTKTVKLERQDANKTNKQNVKLEQEDAGKANKQTVKLEQEDASKANKQTVKLDQENANKTNKQTVKLEREKANKAEKKSLLQLVWDKIT
ncbi:hypothetical protein F9802_13035 [Bacillus aerolatus]|uniref:Uncharacterized protein n=2 Tax=Bacillus aerolatus TaxID=2653354 RepID=A0A6I1FJ78_9BACI|nr:hypothetical protein F9802_13035 [Bacillus aerolatus]